MPLPTIARVSRVTREPEGSKGSEAIEVGSIGFPSKLGEKAIHRSGGSSRIASARIARMFGAATNEVTMQQPHEIN